MFRILGFSILAAFYVSLLTKCIVQKTLGLHTIRPGKNSAAPLKRLNIANRIVMLLAPLTVFACIWFRTTVQPHWLRYTGAAIGIAGVAIMISAAIAIGNIRHSLVVPGNVAFLTRGIYAWSRNPVFLSFDLVYFGLLLLYFNWASLIVSAAVMVLLHLQIVWVEEPYLHRNFGEAYYTYQHAVNRYIGKAK